MQRNFPDTPTSHILFVHLPFFLLYFVDISHRHRRDPNFAGAEIAISAGDGAGAEISVEP